MSGAVPYPARLTVAGDHLAHRHGWVAVQKFGRNNDLDPADGEVLVWDTGTTYEYQTSAQTLELLSSDANDTAAGTGAQKVIVYGLDGDWNLVQEEVTLNGVSAVATTNTFLRVYRLKVTDVGSGNINAGDITCQVSPGGAILATCPAGEGSSFLSLFTIPAGYEGYLYEYDVTTDAALNSEATVRVRTRELGKAFRTSAQFLVSKEAPGRNTYRLPVRLAAKTDLALTAEASALNSKIFAQFTLLLVPFS